MKNPNRRAEERRAAAGIQSRPDTIVIVESRHGSAMRYAEWVSNALDCDMISYSKKYLGYASLYKNVIYIGWVRDKDIRNLNILQQNYMNFNMDGKHIIVAAVGLGDPTQTYIDALNRTNRVLGGFADSFYVLPGRFHQDSLNAADMPNLNNFLKKSLYQSYAKEDADIIAERIQNGYNGIAMDAIQPIVEEIQLVRENKWIDAEEIESVADEEE